MKFLIYAEICLTIGAPTWVVTICWVCFGLSILRTIGEVIKENAQRERDSDAEIEKKLEEVKKRINQ